MLAALVAQEREQEVAPDPLRRLASLLPAEPTLAEQVASRFRLSSAQKKRLATAAARTVDQASDARALAYRLGRNEAMDRLLLAGASVSPVADWDVPQFPLKGGEIVARGIKAGPEVARTLRSLEDRWIAEGFPARERVLEMLDEATGSSPGTG
jgi:poly(A) polymerase